MKQIQKQSSFGYEMNANGMKRMHEGVRNMKNVMKPTLHAIVFVCLDATVHPLDVKANKDDSVEVCHTSKVSWFHNIYHIFHTFMYSFHTI